MFRFLLSLLLCATLPMSVAAENAKLVVMEDNNWKLVLAEEHVLLRGEYWFVTPPDPERGGWALEHAKFADKGYVIVQHGLSEQGASVQLWVHTDGRMKFVTMKWLRTYGYADHEQPVDPEAISPRRYWEAEVFHSGTVELTK